MYICTLYLMQTCADYCMKNYMICNEWQCQTADLLRFVMNGSVFVAKQLVCKVKAQLKCMIIKY